MASSLKSFIILLLAAYLGQSAAGHYAYDQYEDSVGVPRSRHMQENEAPVQSRYGNHEQEQYVENGREQGSFQEPARHHEPNGYEESVEAPRNRHMLQNEGPAQPHYGNQDQEQHSEHTKHPNTFKKIIHGMFGAVIHAGRKIGHSIEHACEKREACSMMMHRDRSETTRHHEIADNERM